MEWRSKNYQSDFISNGECEKGWVSWKVIFFLFVSLSVCGAGDVYLQFPYGLSNWQCVGKSKCECNFEWQPKGCEAVNTQHDSGCSWVLLQSCTAIEMGPSMSKKKKKMTPPPSRCAMPPSPQSGGVRSWGHLTTPFFLASFSYHQVSPWWCSLRYTSHSVSLVFPTQTKNVMDFLTFILH